MGKKGRLTAIFITAIFSLSLLVLLTLLSYKIVLFSANLTPEQQDTINFLNDKEELRLNYTAGEMFHLNDVKKVMELTDYLFYSSLLICTGIIAWHRRNKDFLRKSFLYGGIFAVMVLGLLAVYTIFSFDSAFNIFHRIFFPQGNWLFPADSLLIQTFPADFFVKMCWKIFGTALFLGSLFILLGFFFKNAEHQGN